MVLSIFANKLSRRRCQPVSEGQALDSDTLALADAMDAVQTLVNTLVDQRTGGRYRVSFLSNAGAATNLRTKVIQMPASIAQDPTLTYEQVAILYTGLAAHEVGHTRISFDSEKVLDSLPPDFPKGKRALCWRLFNILDDITLERIMADDHPGIASVFPALVRYLVGADEPGPATVWPQDKSIQRRADFALSATRFAPFTDWGQDPATQEKLTYWQAWGERYAVPDARVRAEGTRIALQAILADRDAATALEIEQGQGTPAASQDPYDDSQPAPVSAGEARDIARQLADMLAGPEDVEMDTLQPSLDDLIERTMQADPRQRGAQLEQVVEDERKTERLSRGAFGKMQIKLK